MKNQNSCIDYTKTSRTPLCIFTFVLLFSHGVILSSEALKKIMSNVTIQSSETKLVLGAGIAGISFCLISLIIKRKDIVKNYIALKKDDRKKQATLQNYILNSSHNNLQRIQQIIDVENNPKTFSIDYFSNFDQVLLYTLKENIKIPTGAMEKLIEPYIKSDNFSMNLIIQYFLPLKDLSSDNQIGSVIIEKIKDNKEVCLNIISTDYANNLKEPLKNRVLQLTN